MQKVNIVVGRFQPFTTGHYSCVKAAMNKRGLPTVICMISVPESKVDKRHPFPSDMLTNLYGGIVFKSNPSIAGVVPVQSADIVKIGETLRAFGFEIAAWTCGTDRFEDYSKKAERYHNRAGLSDDFEVIEVPRGEEDVSATKVRSCLLNNDMEGFLSMIPASTKDGTALYNALKEQIDKVYGKVEKRYRTHFAKLNLEERIAKLEKTIRYK